MCKTKDIFQKVTDCEADELCTGSDNATDAIIGTNGLCEKGKQAIRRNIEVLKR